MEKVNLNLIPEKLANGTLNTKQVLDYICEFINNNPSVFGLQKYSKDFRNDIITTFLEKGSCIIKNYDEKRGNFFTYIYFYISCLILKKIKKLAKNEIIDAFIFQEKIMSIKEKQYKYKNINYKYFEDTKYPYKASRKNTDNTQEESININELKKPFENIRIDKKLLIIAIKSSFYLTDEQMEDICKYYNLNENDFYKTVQYCRSMLTKKAEKRNKIQERRDYAYFNYKKYSAELVLLEQENNLYDDEILKKEILKKKDRYYKIWMEYNNKLANGYISLKPTNKTISYILGICERQIAYNISCAKKELPKELNTDE